MREELTLRPLQQKAIDFIWNKKRVNIFAGMGSGKTTLTLFDIHFKQMIYGDVFPVLIFAPLYVANGVWSAELDRFDMFKNTRYSKVLGTEKQRIEALMQPADVYIINYENAHWLATINKKLKIPFNTIVCDESTKIKNHHRRGRTIGDVNILERAAVIGGTKNANAIVGMSGDVDYWYNLTGTPAPNKLQDLWGQQFPIDFGKALGSTLSLFRALWCSPVNSFHPEWGYEVKKEKRDLLIQSIKKNTIIIDPTEFYSLDKPTIIKHRVFLTDALKKKYKDAEKGVIAELKQQTKLDQISAVAILMKLRQFASGAVLKTAESNDWEKIHSLKLDALYDLIEEINDEPLLVAYYFRYEPHAIKDYLVKSKRRFKDSDVVILNEGNTEEHIKRWNKGDIKVLLIHPQSAGHGLNLQHGGRRICFYTPDFNYEYFAQAVERVGVTRQFQSGYDRKVFIHFLVMQGTVDEQVISALEDKQGLTDYIKRLVEGRAE